MTFVRPSFDGSRMTEPRPTLTFRIPAESDDADELAGELGQLVRSTEWKRAALIYARVRVGTHGGDRSKINSDLATPNAYAKLGISGLRSPTTIRNYWRAWQDAIDDGIAKPAILGSDVALPAAEWSDYYPPREIDIEPPKPAEPPHPPDAIHDVPVDTDSIISDEVHDVVFDDADESQQDMLHACQMFVADTVLIVRKSTAKALEWVNRHTPIDNDDERAEILENIEMARAALDALRRAIVGEALSDSELYRITET